MKTFHIIIICITVIIVSLIIFSPKGNKDSEILSEDCFEKDIMDCYDCCKQEKNLSEGICLRLCIDK